jgi:FkbM family methyltransferase
MFKYKITQIICSILPPILAQKVRSKLISITVGEKLSKQFIRKSFTGSYFLGNTNDFHAFKFSIHGFFDWRNVVISDIIIDKFIKGDVIEVGANIGTETIGFSDITKKYNLNTFAYEPLESNINYIENFIKYNDLKNLYIYPQLVSDYVGEAKFKIPQKNDSGSGFISNDVADVTFKVVKLDDLYLNSKISLLCIDVEGFEYQVLKGASKIIETQSPFLIVEVNKNYLTNRANISLEQFYNFIIEKDYTPYYIKPFGLEKVDINNYKVLPNKNWLCIPTNQQRAYKTITNKLFISAFNPFLN